jgi:hypothetical protein
MATEKYSRPLGSRITLEEPTFAEGLFEAYTAERDRDEREKDKVLKQANLDRTRQDTLKQQDLAREDMLFQNKYQRAINNYESDIENYKINVEQIGTNNPEMIQKINKQFNKEYLIPNRDGTFEKRYVVPNSAVEATDMKVRSKGEFDTIIDMWNKGDLSRKDKVNAWPELKRLNTMFGQNLEGFKASYNRALNFDGNEKILDSIGAFLPQGYSQEDWDKAKNILLKDGEVSEGELKLVASDITNKIGNRQAAQKFWTDFNSKVLDGMSNLKIDSAPGLAEDLTRMSNLSIQNLDTFFPGAGELAEKKYGGEDVEEVQKIMDGISQKMFGKNTDKLNQEEKDKVLEAYENPGQTKASLEIQLKKDKADKKPLEEQVKSGIGYRLEKWIDPKNKGGNPLGKTVKDPVTGRMEFGKNIGVKVRKNPYKYAKKGIISSEEWPFFKEVSVKEALMNWRKGKDMDMSAAFGSSPQPIIE